MIRPHSMRVRDSAQKTREDTLARLHETLLSAAENDLSPSMVSDVSRGGCLFRNTHHSKEKAANTEYIVLSKRWSKESTENLSSLTHRALEAAPNASRLKDMLQRLVLASATLRKHGMKLAAGHAWRMHLDPGCYAGSGNRANQCGYLVCMARPILDGGMSDDGEFEKLMLRIWKTDFEDNDPVRASGDPNLGAHSAQEKGCRLMDVIDSSIDAEQIRERRRRERRRRDERMHEMIEGTVLKCERAIDDALEDGDSEEQDEVAECNNALKCATRRIDESEYHFRTKLMESPINEYGVVNAGPLMGIRKSDLDPGMSSTLVRPTLPSHPDVESTVEGSATGPYFLKCKKYETLALSYRQEQMEAPEFFAWSDRPLCVSKSQSTLELDDASMEDAQEYDISENEEYLSVSLSDDGEDMENYILYEGDRGFDEDADQDGDHY